MVSAATVEWGGVQVVNASSSFPPPHSGVHFQVSLRGVVVSLFMFFLFRLTCSRCKCELADFSSLEDVFFDNVDQARTQARTRPIRISILSTRMITLVSLSFRMIILALLSQ